MNKPRSRISVISVIKFWSSSPPSWYSRSSVLCGGKNKLFNWSFEGFWLSVNFLKIRKFVYVWKYWLSAILVLQIRHFWWLQFAWLYARSRFIHISAYNQKLYIAYKLEIWNSEFCRGIWNTCRRLIPWWNLSNIFVLKHFVWDVLHKESFSSFLFTIYVLKSVFCWVISVWVDRDRCERIKVETQRKISETRS